LNSQAFSRMMSAAHAKSAEQFPLFTGRGQLLLDIRYRQRERMSGEAGPSPIGVFERT
jgi:hypothetical protein